MPKVMLSVGLGAAADHDTTSPLRSVALEVLATRNLVLEAEAMQWDMSTEREESFRYGAPNNQPIVSGPHRFYETNEGWSAGANLLYRWEPEWVAAFVGGGAFFAQQRWSTGFAAGPCVAPGNERLCPQDHRYEETNTGLRLQALAGVDVRVAGPLRAYGSLQFTSLEQNNVRATAGVRVVARTASLADEAKRRLPHVTTAVPLLPEREEQIAGKKVRITLASGVRRRADFVALDGTRLTVREKRVDRTYPLADVFEYGAALAGMGAGAGGLIGALYDRATAGSHIIYAASTPRARVMPLLPPGGAGVAVALGW